MIPVTGRERKMADIIEATQVYASFAALALARSGD